MVPQADPAAGSAPLGGRHPAGLLPPPVRLQVGVSARVFFRGARIGLSRPHEVAWLFFFLFSAPVQTNIYNVLKNKCIYTYMMEGEKCLLGVTGSELRKG